MIPEAYHTLSDANNGSILDVLKANDRLVKLLLDHRLPLIQVAVIQDRTTWDQVAEALDVSASDVYSWYLNQLGNYGLEMMRTRPPGYPEAEFPGPPLNL